MGNALGSLFHDIANAIRGKTGESGTMKPAEFPGKIAGITTGSGGSDDVRYVTFMSYDGTVEYGKKAVAVGDDCADPIARGVFGTPTRESTAQYTYTFAGWATTPNGGLNADALKSVVEDRTVYANFVSTVRSYTISYYDGDTLLKTETLAYGAMPSYRPQKEGFAFTGYEPSLVAVTADATYYAQFEEVVDWVRPLVMGTISGSYRNDRVTYIGKGAFERCEKLTEINFPNVTSVDGTAFNYCTSLVKADLGALESLPDTWDGVLNYNTELETLIMRGNAVVQAGTGSQLYNSKIEKGTGYIYVPSALVDAYKADSKWNKYANQFRAIEDYPDICGGGA